MSVIRKKPFIESVLDTLTTSELSSLKYVMNNGGNNVSVSLVSGSFEKGDGKIITSTITPVYLEVESNKVYSAILIWNASYCVAIPYHRFQDVKLIKINSSTRTYEEIKEYCDINELRRIIDDTSESSFDADGEAGQVLTADGAGGVQWKDNPQIIALTTNLGTLTSDQVALASAGNTVITLNGKYYYRFSKSVSAIVFKATPRVDSGTTYIDNITIDLSDNTFNASYETVAAGEGFTPTYDDELSDISTNAVQNRVVNAALALKADVTDLEDYAKKDGNYPTMTVGAADDLTPYDESAGDDQDDPFLFQATGTGNGSQSDFATGALALMREKRGNSVVVNQLVRNGNFESVGYWELNSNTTYTVSNNVATIVNTSGSENGIYQQFTAIQGHKYLAFSSLKVDDVPDSNDVSLYLYVGGSGSQKYISGTNWNYLATIVEAGSSATTYVKVNLINWENKNVYAKNICVIDLTQWFGGNANIPTDLTTHPENFFRYYQGSLAYNTGTIVNANSRYIKCIGRNQWDEETESGYIDPTTGQSASSGSFLRSKNYCRCIGGAKYYLYGGVGVSTEVILWYDKDKNYLGYYSNPNSVATAPNNACYFKIYFDESTYNNDITVSIYYEGESGYDEYYAYEVLTNNDTGTEALKSAGNVADSKTPDGTITRRIGSVDLGTLTWTYNSGDSSYRAAIAEIGAKSRGQCAASKYFNVDGQTTIIGGIYIGDSNINVFANEGDTPTGTLYYEKATPTTESGTPYSANLVIDDFGSMSFAGTSGVPQGNLIFYPVDYKAFVDTLYDYTEGTPSNLALKSDLTTVDNKIGAKIPECPTNTDGTYVLKATVSSGTVTYTWVLEE